MNVIEIQFAPWDNVYYFSYPTDKIDQSIKKGTVLVVKTGQGLEIGRVIGFTEVDDALAKEKEISPYIRVATNEDLAILKKLNENKEDKIDSCQEMIKKNNLDMKLVDCQTSFDDGRIVFAFIADGRIDFRNLVKDLTRKYKKLIRLHQLGVRDEAKYDGDFGSCGRCLCCRSHLKDLGNVSTEFAKDQQIAHRGSERLSGICGRLKCCLAYEEDLYKDMLAKLPNVGTKVKTKDGQGQVIGINVLEGSYDVRIKDEKKGDSVVREYLK